KERMEEERHRRIVLAKGLVAHYSFADLVGDTLQETILKAKRFSQVDATVSIWGESGTGKELFAHSIHASSPRCQGPFVAVNCAALPETLLESELFGYEEGAFTGAKKGGKIGLFELANEGTIFLDEIGKMSMGLQAGLLRVLQTREVRRVGGDSNIPVNVRVIAASNEELRGAVEAGEFRADLYYRLNILTLRVPSLRERPGDVAALKGSILQRLAGKLGFTPKITPEFTEVLFRYNWPGNVRELENVLERYTVLFGADNTPDVEELRDSFPELPWGTYKSWDNRNQKDFPVQDAPGNTGFEDGTTHVLNKETTAPGCETSGGIDGGSSRKISNGIMNGIKDGSPAGGLYRENKAGIAAEIVAKEASDEGDPDEILVVLPGTLEEMEIQLIMAMLKTVNGNRSLLAEKLGISRTTLWKKLQPFYPSDISH
ncbi:MAG TPA: sigma 54-interacting transcriptional regulator, partial [Verrucomicrobiae bacterium]|nr:sigma 54-interacting transcriptional regulator [Verrucomicrobiae bacterium]